ncbi:ECF RNA polymerase sigma factor SigH [Microbacterium oxydans]|uniref:ECF RNA polymerase sigma factor SigH n=1 Tax=Microbacterium oxydans TaxID=82380 RepID=A0A0F0KNX9_9MICO|nr:RNA polymerase sigma factor [Microbacterium oxydans]KJL22164.1 ECF RNA polymerase sigma factor SigH [Microbacterium oxydans]
MSITLTTVDDASAKAGLTALLASEPQRLRRRGISLGVPVDEADDVAQDIAARAWQAVTSVRSAAPGSLCAWLDMVARSVVVDSARRCQRRPFQDHIDAWEVEAPRRVEEEVEAKERLRAAREAIAALPPSLRDPLVLRVDEDLSAVEIAGRLDISVLAVRQRLARARRLLGG